MTTPSTLLTRVRVEGFRSLKNVTLDLRPINVLIGPNGAGKSNLLSVLRLVPLMRTQNLRYFVGREGGASTLLHHGPATTREIELDLTFASDQGANAYHARLGYSAHDSLIFLDESVRYERPDQEKPLSVSLGAGYGESLLMERARDPEAKTERVLNGLLDRMSFFHFQDTPFTSPLRKNSVAADNRTLRSDGSNLAAVMYRLRTTESPDLRPAWNLIEGLVKRVARPSSADSSQTWLHPNYPTLPSGCTGPTPAAIASMSTTSPAARSAPSRSSSLSHNRHRPCPRSSPSTSRSLGCIQQRSRSSPRSFAPSHRTARSCSRRSPLRSSTSSSPRRSLLSSKRRARARSGGSTRRRSRTGSRSTTSPSCTIRTSSEGGRDRASLRAGGPD